jgi:hypothetical protein
MRHLHFTPTYRAAQHLSSEDRLSGEPEVKDYNVIEKAHRWRQVPYKRRQLHLLTATDNVPIVASCAKYYSG